MHKTTALVTTALVALSTATPALAKNGADDGPGDDRGGQRESNDDRGGNRGRDDDRGRDRDRIEIRKPGSCGAGATSKIKVKPDDGRIEVEFEVDRNRSGERWKVTISRDGKVTNRGTGVTGGRSGSFSFERHISNLPGADRISARAVGPGGRTCTATATLPG